MVSRISTKNAGQRSQSSMSRGTMRTVNTKGLWNEVDVDVLKGETATGVEWAENYGTTSVPAKQDEDEDKGGKKQAKQSGGTEGGSPGKVGEQPEGDSAEPIIGYMNGARDHPVVTVVRDARHRLRELEEGDVAQHRLKDDRQQFLLSKDGTYLSTRDDKVMRVALVPKEPPPEQQQQGQNVRGAGPGEGQQGGKKKKTYGQKSAKDDNKKSSVAIEQNGKETYSQHGQFYAAQRGGSDASTYYDSRKKSSQTTQTHVHMRFEDNRIWVDEEGHWSEMPIQQKKDRHCKD
jgi:hypothetical protein